MRGRLPGSEPHPDDDDSTAHGLKCPVCDEGTLLRRATVAIRADLQTHNRLERAGAQAKYVYECDSCDYTEQVVRNAQEE